MVSVSTAPAVAGQAAEHLEIARIGMAGGTVIPGVPSRGDGKPGVIESSLVPGGVGGPVARITGCWKPGGHMVGVSGLLVVGAMAAVTFSRRPGVSPIFMTGRTLKRGMDTLAGKDAVMVEGSLIPAGVGRQMA